MSDHLSMHKKSGSRSGNRLVATTSVLILVTTAFAISPVGAHHACAQPGYRERNVCIVDNRHGGDPDKDVTVSTPRLVELDDSPKSWLVARARNTGSYHYMYATGGRELDDIAIWRFSRRKDGTKIRGIYSIEVRIPKDGVDARGRRRNASASVRYSVSIRDKGSDTRRPLGTFMIDQRRQQGWVDARFELALASPEELVIEISDQYAWPDYFDAGYSKSRVTVDAVRLKHEKILPSDIETAQFECVARTREGREIDLESETDIFGRYATISAGLSAGFSAASALPAVSAFSATPLGAGIFLGIGISSPLSTLFYGEDILGAWASLMDAKRLEDITAVVNGATFGGEWQRASDYWGRSRYYYFDDPGPCELFPEWRRYLPSGA